MKACDSFHEPPVTVSVVIPCLNEARTIRSCIESVVSSSSDNIQLEIIVVDGGSDDGTLEILAEMQQEYEMLGVLDNEAKITPIGLNMGIKASMGEFILVLGAHTTTCPSYVETLVKDLQNDPTAACAGGVSTSVSGETLFQQVAGCVGESRFGVGSSDFRIGAQTKKYVDTVAYGLYRKEALDRVGLFDERLIRNQDIELSHRIRQNGYNIILNPDVSAYYYPRSSLSGFCKQGFSNGYWNITTHRLVPGSLSMRHFVPLLAVMCGIGLFVLSFYSFWAKVVLSLLVASYLALAMYESVSISLKKRNPRALLSLFVFPLLHVSYGLGSLCSLVSLSTRGSR